MSDKSQNLGVKLPHEKDRLFFYTYQKSARLCKAVSFLLNNVDDDVLNIKDILDMSVSIHKDIVSSFIFADDVSKKRTVSSILSLPVLLSVLEARGLISQANIEILISEYIDLGRLIESSDFNSRRSISKSSFEIKDNSGMEISSRDFSNQGKPTISESSISLRTDSFSSSRFAGDINSSSKNMHDNTHGLSRTFGIDSRKGPASSMLRSTDFGIKDSIQVGAKINLEHVGGERSSKVLSFIRAKGSVMIKDVLSILNGVSEKTVQRELSKLVGLGILKREGERRWSRYSVNK